ncbi:hypothetical protein ACIGEZ_14275 [Streptomyces sp. NPDC085481]|uniref:hypothetical protein n=1 Tax=Streptomyces sp. NPDC085481 TaxID=3365727 RepID=UPI0037D1E4BA
MAKTIDDLSNEVAQLRDALTKGTENFTYKVPNAKDDKKQDDKTALVSQLKHSLIGDAPKILTEEATQPWVKQIGDIHEEATKAPLTEWLEAAGLDGVAAGVEKIKEGKNFGTIWPYFASAFMGLAIPAIGLLLAAMSINIVRNVTEKITGRILAGNANGGWSLQNRTAVEQRENRVFNGGTSLADIPPGTNFDALRNQLQTLNPHLEKFNDQAPKFTREFGKLPKANAITKTADAVEKIKNALTGLDTDKITALAKALGKLTGAVKHHDPKKVPDPGKIERLNTAMAAANPAAIKEMATATGKLASAQRHFDPKKLPKAGSLSSAARAAERLADAGRDVAQAFNNLRLAAQRTAAEI